MIRVLSPVDHRQGERGVEENIEDNGMREKATNTMVASPSSSYENRNSGLVCLFIIVSGRCL